MIVSRLACLSALFVGGCLMTACENATAAVMLQNSATQSAFNDPAGSAFGALTFSGFDLMGGNAVVAIVTHEENDTATNDFPTATFGGVPMTAVATNNNPQITSVFYSLGVSGVEDLVVTPGQSSDFDGIAVTVLSLGGVLGVGDTAVGTSGGSFDLQYDGVAGGFVVGGWVDNTSGGGSTSTITGGNIDTFPISFHGSWGAGGSVTSAGHVHGYGSIGTDGTFTETFNELDGSSRNAGALVAFTPAVPAPGSLGMLATLVLGLVARRR